MLGLPRGVPVTPFSIAGLQLDLSSPPTQDGNLARLAGVVDHLMATFPFVEMVVMSELAPLGSSPARAEPLPGPAESALAALAARHHIWLVPGSLFEARGDVIYNT